MTGHAIPFLIAGLSFVCAGLFVIARPGLFGAVSVSATDIERDADSAAARSRRETILRGVAVVALGGLMALYGVSSLF